jgi:probable rRNA maturation factor
MRQVMEQIDDPGGSSAPGENVCTLDVLDAGAALAPAQLAWLRRTAQAAIGQAAPGLPGEVRVRIVDDAAMAAAHLKYSNVPGTTDVLTFDLTGGASAQGEPLDVDILACADEAGRQGAARGHSLERELLLYILHGVLHCLGHDDHDDVAFATMHAEEDRILSAIGVGATFHRGGEGEGA